MSGRLSELGDDELGAVLRTIGADLDITPAPTAPPRRYSTPVIVAGVAALAVAAVLVIAPAPRTVADWLGIGGVDIEVDRDVVVTDEDPLVAGPALDSPAVDEALERPAPDLSETALGTPDAWHAAPEGGAIAVWNERRWSLWLIPIADPDGEVYFSKTVSMAQQVTAVDGLGDGAVLVTGDHVLASRVRRVSAGNVVLWDTGDGALLARLEAPSGDELASNTGELVVAAAEIDAALSR